MRILPAALILLLAGCGTASPPRVASTPRPSATPDTRDRICVRDYKFDTLAGAEGIIGALYSDWGIPGEYKIMADAGIGPCDKIIQFFGPVTVTLADVPGLNDQGPFVNWIQVHSVPLANGEQVYPRKSLFHQFGDSNGEVNNTDPLSLMNQEYRPGQIITPLDKTHMAAARAFLRSQ